MKSGQKSSFRLAQEDVEPRGDAEALEAAKKCLGPFHGRKFEHSEATDEQYAEQRVIEIARSYNWHRLLNAQSPRSKAVKESLDELIEGTAVAFRAIQGLDDFSRFMFETSADHPKFSKRHAEANAKGLPSCSFNGSSDRASIWLIQLNALHQLARDHRALIEIISGDDRGGRTNLYKEVFNSPEHHLVEQGWYLFDFFKPGQAKGSLNNNFPIFLQNVYEFATGEGANEEGAPALMNKIKQMIGHLRAVKPIRERVDAAEKVVNSILERGFDDEAVAQLSTMRQDLEELDRELPTRLKAFQQSTSKKRRG